MNASPNYKAYLLRLWLAGDGDQPEWRASLEDPGTGEVRGFSDLEEMVTFLKVVESLVEQKTKEQANIFAIPGFPHNSCMLPG